MQKDKNILRYEEAAQFLPARLRKAALALPEQRRAEAEEFRLRAGRPIPRTWEGLHRSSASNHIYRRRCCFKWHRKLLVM